MACFCSSGEEAADRGRGSAISTRRRGVGGSTETEEGEDMGRRRLRGGGLEMERIGEGREVGDWRGLT
jgi:hypothetical protein